MPAIDPVAAYDRLAPGYSSISQQRIAYLLGVERLIARDVGVGTLRMLDVGAGDATRSVRLAKALGVRELTLVEPSAAMQALWPCGLRAWTTRIEDTPLTTETFDVITCLWNVLGHIFPAARRVRAMQRMRELLAPSGKMFVDVSHRYNMLHYGIASTLGRMMRDVVSRADTSGDVVAQWQIDGQEISTHGHVFTAVEMRRLARQAKLHVHRRYSVDYGTGDVRSTKYAGHLLYVFTHPRPG